MEQPISEDKGINLSSPDAPLKIFDKMTENAQTGKDMDVPAFLDDLRDLKITGALENPAMQQQAFSTGRAAQVLPGTLPFYGIEGGIPESATVLAPKIEVKPAPPIKLDQVDSNSPMHWDGKTLYAFNSTIEGIKRLSGPDLAHLRPDTNKVTFDNKLNGSRWMEATFKDQASGLLYGWYHFEPTDLPLPKRQQPLTAPRIGAAVSKDNGRSWHDLGFIIDAPDNTLKLDTINLYFAGGNGDFSVIPDRNSQYFYFFVSNYERDPTQQGVAVARMRSEDLGNPLGKVWKWHQGKWEEKGAGGQVSPIFAANGDLHGPKTDYFWGPSIHWNEYLKTYVMVLNHAQNAAWEQEGIYLSLNPDLSNPQGWSHPQKIKDIKGKTDWYPQVAGINENGSDKDAGQTVRLFVTGKSAEIIQFEKPNEKTKTTLATFKTAKPNFFRPGSNEQVSFAFSEKGVEVLHPVGNYRFLIQTSTGQFEILMDQLDVQGNLSWEKDLKRLDWLGFDCAQPSLIDKIPQIGAGVVRIPVEGADKDFFDNNPSVKEAIKKAREKNLEILLLYNPGKLLSATEDRRRINNILSLVEGYDKVLLELGNEPDTSPFWENHDLNSYAQFVKQASKIIWERKPQAQIVVAAAINKELIQEIVEVLKGYVDINRFIFALHAYQNEKDVEERIKLLKQIIGPDGKFILDELGVNESDDAKGQRLPAMIETARRNGAQRVIVFQLRNIDFEGGDGFWGVVSPDGKWEKPVWKLVDYAWGQTHTK